MAPSAQDRVLTFPRTQISPHFTASELWCPHCHLLRLDYALLGGLELLREKLNTISQSESDVGVIVNSAYRCSIHNSNIGGSKNSQHLLGRAADVRWKGDIIKLYQASLLVPLFSEGGIGLDRERNFLHVDVRTSGPARWGYKGGKLVDIKEVL